MCERERVTIVYVVLMGHLCVYYKFSILYAGLEALFFFRCGSFFFGVYSFFMQEGIWKKRKKEKGQPGHTSWVAVRTEMRGVQGVWGGTSCFDLCTKKNPREKRRGENLGTEIWGT